MIDGGIYFGQVQSTIGAGPLGGPPTVTSISPTSATQYDDATVLTVNGTNFTATSVIKIDGASQTTTFVNSTQLTCTLPAGQTPTAILAVSGAKTVTVGAAAGQTFTVNAWALTDVTGLQGWWRADAGNVTIATGVSQWNDTSGNARHLTQATGSAQPAHTSSLAGMNNQPAVTFDGSNDQLTGAAWSNFVAVGAYTIMAAIYPTAAPTNSATIYANTGILSDPASGLIGLYLRSAPDVGLYNWDGSEDKDILNINALSTGSIITGMHSSGNLITRLGTGSESAGTASGNTTSLAGLLSMGRAYNNVNFYTGSICEVAIWNVVISAANRDRAARYMRARYAL